MVRSAMVGMAVVLVALLAQWTLGAEAGSTQTPGQTAAGRRSIWDGVYTDEQAARGRMQYEYSCAQCHLEELQGDSSKDVPALSGDRFLNDWNGRSVKDLIDVVSKTMPGGSPGSLRPQSYRDILAYVMQLNEFPAGTQEFPADPGALEQILIEKRPGSKNQ